MQPGIDPTGIDPTWDRGFVPHSITGSQYRCKKAWRRIPDHSSMKYRAGWYLLEPSAGMGEHFTRNLKSKKRCPVGFGPLFPTASVGIPESKVYRRKPDKCSTQSPLS